MVEKGVSSRLKTNWAVILRALLRVLINKESFRNKKELIEEIINEINKNKSSYIESERGIKFSEKKEKIVNDVVSKLEELKNGLRKRYEPFEIIYVILREAGIFTEYSGAIYSHIYKLQLVVPKLENVSLKWEHSLRLLGLTSEQLFVEKDDILNIPKENVEYFIHHLQTSNNNDYRRLLEIYNEVTKTKKELSERRESIYKRYRDIFEEHLMHILNKYNSMDVHLYKDNIVDSTFLFVIDYGDPLNYIAKELLKTNRNYISLGAFTLAESSDENIIKSLVDDILLLLSESYKIKNILEKEISEYYNKRKEYIEKKKEVDEIMNKIKNKVKSGGILEGYCDICKAY